MGQYDFISPGAAVHGALEDLLVKRAAAKRQAMLDALTQQQAQSQEQDRLANREIQRANAASLDQQRQAIEEERRLKMATTMASTLTPGPIKPAAAAGLAGTPLAHLVTPPTAAAEARSVEATPSVAPSPVMLQGGNPIAEPDSTYAGLPEQRKEIDDRKRQEDYIKTLDPESPEAKALKYESMTGKSAPAGMFDKKPSNHAGIVAEYEYYVEQVKAAGQKPLTFTQYQDEDANRKKLANNGAGGAPYIIPVSTGNGIMGFNTRTGQFDESSRHDLKPSATAESDITKAQSTLYQISKIERLFSPDRIGPLKGRYNNMQLALVGEMGDQGLADMSTALSTLQNTVINLRTGAQMSEPEAARILNEIPNMNLPPDTFVAKLASAKDYFENWMSNRAKNAYGRNTPADVDNIVKGRGVTPTAPSAAPAPGAPAKPTAADLLKKYGGK